jgi:dihydrofolate reductase
VTTNNAQEAQMVRLNYLALMSLDGYIADEVGNFDWAAPDDDVHRFINDLIRPVGTFLYGRRMYEVMAVWETMGAGTDEPDAIVDFARIWRSSEKIVYSRTLDSISSSRTRIERDFNPEIVREMKSTAGHDMAIGGPDLATNAFKHQLVDECYLFIAPVLVGAGKRGLPERVRLDLELLDERRFGNGMVYLHYRIQQ